MISITKENLLKFGELKKYEQRIIVELIDEPFRGRFQDLCKKIGSSINCTPAVHRCCLNLEEKGIIEITRNKNGTRLEQIKLSKNWMEKL